jgi:dephospho-CoA kinase
MSPGQPVYTEVVRHFGASILNPDMTVNRAKLAEAVFGPKRFSSTAKPSRVDELNRIVHPEVLRKQEVWMNTVGRADPQAIAIVEAALILEAGAAKQFDRLVVVTCSDEQRVARFASRQKIDIETARKEVARRMAAQLSEAEKIAASDYVIDNSKSLDQTRQQVAQVWREFHFNNFEKPSEPYSL